MEGSKVSPSGGVRGRVREAIRSELTAAALSLIQTEGFANTTASAIASAVGVSERTFFRYFPTKEDAVLQPVEALGASIADELRRRPAEEPDLEALRRSFDVAVDAVIRAPDTMAVIMQLNQAEPALRRRHLQQQDSWIDDLLAGLIERAGSPADRPRKRMQCAVMMLAWEKALTTCLNVGEFTDVGDQLDIALADLRSFMRAEV